MYKNLREKLNEIIDYWENKEDGSRDEDVMSFEDDIKEWLDEVPEFKLYRYTSAQYYSLRNFEKQTIHLSPNGVMNDIYEGLPANDIRNCSPSVISSLGDMASMTCFTQSKDNTLMWSHYGDSSRGICVEYDLMLLDANSEIFSHLFPVIYTSKRFVRHNVSTLQSSMKDLRRAIEDGYEYDGDLDLNDILPLFVYKGKDWEYENEWRIIYTKKQIYDEDRTDLYSGNLQFPCVTGIYLGYRIDSEIKNNVLEIAERMSAESGRKIRVYQARLSNESYDITFDECN